MSATDLPPVPSSAPNTPTADPDDVSVARLRIGDMDCPSCVAKIEGHLASIDGILGVSGSAVSRTLTVRYDGEVSAGRIKSEVGRLGYVARIVDDGEDAAETARSWRDRAAKVTYAAMALFAVGLALRWGGVASPVVPFPGRALGVPDLFFLAAALVGGTNFFSKGLRAAWHLTLDMNFLMTVAIVGAIAIGETLEAGAIAFLFSVAELLERFSVDRARASVEALMELAPDAARVLRDGEEWTVPVEDVRRDDLLLVRPGERIAADGVVEDGASAVDQSTITGEPLPTDKEEGDEVFAGTVNGEGFLRIRVSRAAGESTLARIVRLVEEAEERKSRSERFVETFARYYTPAVTVAAVLVVAVPTLGFGAPFGTWFVRGLTLLVIACPCALVISTPVAVVSGITAAARNGVLIKGGSYLEAMGAVDVMAFDKTGTLTLGHPTVVDVSSVDGVDMDEVLARAAAVETGSEHPVARAIAREARAKHLELPWRVTDFEALRGVGARAHLDDVPFWVGKPEALSEAGVEPPPFRKAGHTMVAVTREDRLLGWIALADRPRDRAPATMAELRRLGLHRVVMLTGDHEDTARALGKVVGIDDVRASLLPQDKVAAVERLGEEGTVAMVGDGVNDAPALAVASVGIVMGAAGSDVALETADVALMGDDLTKLPYLTRLSRRARRVIRQNIAAAILVKAILAVGVPLGLVSLVTAVVVGDLGVSLAVTTNALRLGRDARQSPRSAPG